MKILRSLSDLSSYLGANDCRIGCFADTGFLYAFAYDDDRLFNIAVDVHSLLSEYEIPIYANVISRMEFVDLIFRKQVTNACIRLFEKSRRDADNQSIYNFLKDIRDKDTAARKRNESYKINEGRLKVLRNLIKNGHDVTDWKDFCKQFVGSILVDEWKLLEEELGLNFVEVLEGEPSDLMNAPLAWDDMVQVMGENGMRGPDAMIVNLFSKSKFPLLITSDSDFETCFDNSSQNDSEKTILIL
jgi:hypothetical protein